jgi:hypothetical protein
VGSGEITDATGNGDDVLPRGGEEVGWGEIMAMTALGAKTTYNLQVERELDGVTRVKSRLRLHSEQRQRTFWMWRGSGIG